MGVPSSKLARFKEERFGESLRKQLQGGKQQDGENRIMNVSYLVCMVPI